MSDATERAPEDRPSEGSQPEASAPAATPPKPRRRWRRWLGWSAIAILLILVIARIALPFALPSILNGILAERGLECSYDQLDLSLLAGDVEIWRLAVKEKGQEEPAVALEKARADLAIWPLFTGRVVLRTVEVDGLDVRVERDADGIRFLGQSATAPAEETPAEVAEPTPPDGELPDLDFRLPVQVDALRVQHVYATLVDRTTTPPSSHRIDVHVRVSDLGSPDRPGRFEVLLASVDLLESLRVEGTIDARQTSLDGKLTVSMRGFRPAAIAGFLEPLGVRGVAREIEFDLASAVTAAVDANDAKRGHASLEVDGISLRADGHEAFGFQRLTTEVPDLSLRSIRVADVTMSDIDVVAARAADGTLRFAGLAIGAPPPAPAAAGATRRSSADESDVGLAVATAREGEAEPRPAAGTEAKEAPAPASPEAVGTGLRWIVERARTVGVRLRFRDEAVTPPVDLAIDVEEVSASGLADLATDGASSFDVRVAAPGLFESARLSGELRTANESIDAEFAFRASAIAPSAIAPYLAAAGVEATLQAGDFVGEGAVTYRSTAEGTNVDARLGGIAFRDGEELFRLGRVAISGIRIPSQPASEVSIDAVEVADSHFPVVLEPGGSLRALGFRVLPAASSGGAAPSPSSTPSSTVPSSTVPSSGVEASGAESASPPSGPTPVVRLGKLEFRDHSVTFRDETVEPPTEIAIADAGLELTGLVIGGVDATPAKLRAWLTAPDVVERAGVEGTISLTQRGSSLALRASGDGLATRRLRPYILAAGVEPLLESASFAVAIETDVRDEDGVPTVDASIRDASLRDGDTTWLSLAGLTVRGLSAGDAPRVEAVEIDRPRAFVRRDPAGGVLVAGIRIPPPSRSSARAGEAEPSPEDGPSATGSSGGSSSTGTPDGPSATGSPLVARGSEESTEAPVPEADLFALGRFELKAAEVEWVDDAVAPSVHAVPRVDVRLDDLRVGSTIDAASSLRVVLQVPEIIAALEVSGQVNASTVSPSFDFTIDGRGIEAGPLAAYLPPEVRATIEDGALRARLRASIAPHDEGGTSARLEVEGVDYRGAGDLGPLFGCGAARIVARRVDPDAGIIALDEIAIEGVEARVRRTSSGSFSAFGIEVVVAPAATEGEAPAEGLPETTPVAEAAPVGPADGVASTGGVSSTLPIAAPDVEGSAAPRLVLRGDLPLLTLEKLSLHLASLTVTDESGEGAAPVEIADWTFANAAPIRLLGPDTAEPTPLALTLRGRVDPLIDQVAVDIRGAPFASEPEFSVDVAVTGIHGPQLVKVAPAVAETMHANELVDGEFRLHTQATLRAKRRDALDFSLANGFGLEFLLSGLDLRRKGDEASLLGLDELRVDVARVAPTGDVHVRSIEIAKPRAIIRRDEEGLHVLGLVVKLPEPAPAETDAAAEGPAAVPEIAATEIAVTSEVASNSVAQPAPEFKLDQLVISGVDLLIEDTTGSRPTILPIDELEVELKQFTTLTFTENRPFRFSVYVGAGDVELPKRLEKSFLAGALSDLATIAVGGDVAGETERRSVFEEITASGKLSLHEPYSGWVKTGVSALELAALRGIVEPSGVVITDGVLDSRASVRFEPDGTMDVDTRSSFIRLAVTEPANGPITRYLKLPAPLDQVLFVLRDQEGATTLPAAFALPGGEISPASISLAAARAIGTVIVDAFTAAPLRAAGTALELVGLQGASAKEDLSSLAVRLDFTAGDVAVLEAQRAKLEPLLEKLRDDETLVLRVQHEFGALDLERSAELANPSREDLLELASRLTERRRELLRERDSLAAEAKAFFAASRPDRADGLRERIQARDREIGEAELALDDVYARLRPGAERQADRRTRAAAIDLARLRLQSVERALLQTAGVPEIDRRIQANPARFSEPTSEGGGGIVVTPVVSAERK